MKKIILLFILIVTAIWLFGHYSNIVLTGVKRTNDKSLKAIIDSLKIDGKTIYFEIDKSDYRLTVKSGTVTLKDYAVVFGPDPVNDKLRQGDGCTPEGWFIIQSKYPHKNWKKFMWLNYPTKDSWKKHNEAIEKKVITKNDGIGGEIGIHGVPEGTDAIIGLRQNWTAGCVSLRNVDVEEIYSIVKPGSTKVLIQK